MRSKIWPVGFSPVTFSDPSAFALTLLSLLLAASCGCRTSSSTTPAYDLSEAPLRPQRAVLKVGPRIITEGEVYRRVLKRFGSPEILWGIASEELLRLAASERGIKIKREEVEEAARKRYQAWLEKSQGDPLVKLLKEKGIFSESALLDTFRQEVESEMLLSKVVSSFRSLDENTLRRYYQRTYAQERLRVRRISFPILPGQSKEKAYEAAKEFCKRIRSGESWEEAAQSYLVAQPGRVPKALGGERWLIGKEEGYPKELKDKLFALKVGEISDPIWEEGFGYHVFKVEERLPPEPFSECVEKLRKEIRALPPDPEEVQQVLSDLEELYPIKFFPP